MHDAYEPVPILEKLPLQIDCLAAWGESVSYLSSHFTLSCSVILMSSRGVVSPECLTELWPCTSQCVLFSMFSPHCRGLAACWDKTWTPSPLQNQEGCRCDGSTNCVFGFFTYFIFLLNLCPPPHQIRDQPVWGDTGKIQQELFKENPTGKKL